MTSSVTTRTRLTLALAAAVAAISIGSSAGSSRAAAGSLLIAASPGQTPSDLPSTLSDRSIRRMRYVTVDFAQLRTRGEREMAREPALTLELFPDVTVFAEFRRYDEAPRGMVWVGRVDGVDGSTVTLAYGGGVLTGTVAVGNRLYQVRPVQTGRTGPGASLHVVTELDQSALPREADAIEVRLTPEQMAAAVDAPMGDEPGQLDLMVLYTPLAENHAGGQAGITNLINLGVSDTNTAFTNSGVNTRIRLVHAARIDYVEPSNLATILTELQRGERAFSGVPGLRNQVGADMVKLLVHPTAPFACGIGFLMTQVTPAFAPAAYTVTDTQCVPQFTFAHELGHNMGARHDWFVDAGTTPFPYAHGYANPAEGQRWRTIMAYNDVCAAAGFNCFRVPYWSTPDRRYITGCDTGRFNCGLLQYWYRPGAPVGVPAGMPSCEPRTPFSVNCEANVARAMNNTIGTVANFRQRIIADAR